MSTSVEGFWFNEKVSIYDIPICMMYKKVERYLGCLAHYKLKGTTPVYSSVPCDTLILVHFGTLVFPT